MKKAGGFTKSYRKKWDNPVFRSKQEAAVFAWMCDTAQWQNTTIKSKFGPLSLKRGELVISEREIADDFGLSRATARLLISRMKDAQMIDLIRDRIPARAGTVCVIINYDKYQSLTDHDGDMENHKSLNLQPQNEPQTQPEDNRKATANQTKNKEDNKLNEKNIGGASAPPYAFVGRTIKLKPDDLDRWRKSYPNIADIIASLQAADDYYSEHPPPDGKWFFPVSNWLRKDNEAAAVRKKEATRGDDWW